MKKALILTSIVCFALIIVAFFPISFSKDKHIVENGIISKIYEGGVKDVVIELENNKNTFYINRGYEKYTLEEIQNLINKDVKITYSNGFTPLDLDNNRSKSIEKLEINNTVFFLE